MLTIDHYLAKGNRLPSLTKILTSADSLPINLTDAVVTFSMWDFATATARITAASVVITSALAGTVRYDWTAGDAALNGGYYYARFTITYSDGRVMSVPNDSWLVIYISETK
jgi:hypothetical protein